MSFSDTSSTDSDNDFLEADEIFNRVYYDDSHDKRQSQHQPLYYHSLEEDDDEFLRIRHRNQPIVVVNNVPPQVNPFSSQQQQQNSGVQQPTNNLSLNTIPSRITSINNTPTTQPNTTLNTLTVLNSLPILNTIDLNMQNIPSIPTVSASTIRKPLLTPKEKLLDELDSDYLVLISAFEDLKSITSQRDQNSNKYLIGALNNLELTTTLLKHYIDGKKNEPSSFSLPPK